MAKPYRRGMTENMGRVGVDYAAVAEAADSLVSEKLPATHERVRQKLGYGSYSTIGRHLKHWHRLRQGQAGIDERGLPQTLAEATQSVWQAIRQQAEVQASETEEAAEAKIAQANRVADKEIERIKQEVREQLAIASTERDEAQKQAQAADKRAHAERIVAAQQTAETQRVAQTLASAQAELQRLQDHLQHVSQSHQKLQADHDALTQTSRDLAEKLRQAQVEAQRLQAEGAAHVVQMTRQHAAHEKQVAHLDARLEKAKAALLDSQAQAHVAEARGQLLKQTLDQERQTTQRWQNEQKQAQRRRDQDWQVEHKRLKDALAHGAKEQADLQRKHSLAAHGVAQTLKQLMERQDSMLSALLENHGKAAKKTQQTRGAEPSELA